MSSASNEAEKDIFNAMKGFVLEYNAKLGDIREVLSETISEAWSSTNDLVGLDIQPHSTLHIRSLIKTPNNPNIGKFVTVFAVLCEEIQQLRNIAQDKFYGQLAMFGHRMEPLDDLNDASPSDKKIFKQYYTKSKPLPIEEQMGAFLPVLQDLSNYMKRVYALIRNYVAQLSSVFSDQNKMYLASLKTADMDCLFEPLGQLLSVIVTLDTIIGDNQSIHDGWTAYRRMIQYVTGDPERYHLDDDKASVMEQLVTNLDGRIMSVRLLDVALQQEFSLPVTGVNTVQEAATFNSPSGAAPGNVNSMQIIIGNKTFAKVFAETLQRLYTRYKAGLNDTLEIHSRHRFIDLCALYSLFFKLFHSHPHQQHSKTQTIKFDKSLYRSLWELQSSIPIVPLYGRSYWLLPEFMITFCKAPSSVTLKPSPRSVASTRNDILTSMENEFLPRVQLYYQHLSAWIVRIEGDLAANTTSSSRDAHQLTLEQLLFSRGNLLLNGLLLANQIRIVVLSTLHLYLHCNRPFPRRVLYALFMSIEMLKSIQHTYSRRLLMISECYQHTVSFLQHQLSGALAPIRERIQKRQNIPSKITSALADMDTSFEICLDLLRQPSTSKHHIVFDLALALGQTKWLLKTQNDDELRFITWKLKHLSCLSTELSQLTDCSFIYWIGNALPYIFKDIYHASHSQVNRLQYILLSTRDCSLFIHRSVNYNPSLRDQLVSLYQAEVRTYFRSEIILPLVRHVETDLRLHIHSIALEQPSLTTAVSASSGKTTTRTKDVSGFFTMESIRMFDEIISIKSQVEHALESLFYDHNTLALHDAKIYSDMKNLAESKYGLQFLLTTLLPAGASHYSDSLDVLEIMRNIHVFVVRYNYNMNTQVFIERAVDQKHLNIINVEHISTSIRTHGMGVLNTTVNFTYQFLTRKFMLISEFLFDDHIKSPLIREVRQWKSYIKQQLALQQQQQQQLQQLKQNERKNRGKTATPSASQSLMPVPRHYAYDWANKLVREIKKLGVNDVGLSYLDQLRMQITEIGNALGYVRLVRSGGLHVAASSTQVIPDMDNPPSLQNLTIQSALSTSTQQAAKTVDDVIVDVLSTLAEGTDYFYILVKIFGDIALNDEHSHLRNFYMIIPALTINFVDTMLLRKEKLNNRSGRSEASFTDDGFALGVSYLLTLFQQDSDFDSLYWFESAIHNFKEQRQKLAQELQQAQKQKDKTFDYEHTELNLRRFDLLIAEWELLSFVMNGSRIFFRPAVDLTKEEQKDNEDKAEDSANSAATTTADANQASTNYNDDDDAGFD